jgi:hypothetical protein
MGVLDRRKHDVDIIERVLGGIRDTEDPQARTRVVDVNLPWASEDQHPTLEVTVGLEEPPQDRHPRTRRRS